MNDRTAQSQRVWPTALAVGLTAGIIGGVGGAWGWNEFGPAEPSVSNPYADGSVTIRPAPIKPADASVVAVAATLLPSTVQVVAELDGVDDGATGSGFVFDDAGNVITNNHVVDSAARSGGQIYVVDAQGTKLKASVVGRSTVYDLAVLNIVERETLVPAALGASAALQVGEPVVAIGSPLGLSSTVTSGIVSAMNRAVTTGDSEDELSYINAVQTDAAINPGNSGGPLVNLTGQVVGVNSAIATSGTGARSEAGNIGVGFAIPIEQVVVTAQQLIETGRAAYPIIGAKVDASFDDPAGDGAEVVSVEPGSPAAEAGIKTGDLITTVGQTRVGDGVSLIVAIRTYQPGDTVELTVNSAGDDRNVDVVLASQSE